MTGLTCFKSYDIRGRIGDDLDAALCYRIGRGFARVLTPQTVVLGRDCRDSSPALRDAVAEGLRDEGVDVLDIGLCGTEEVYFATTHFQAGGGLMVTASHNPIDYNGIKMVARGSRPVSGKSGLREIHDLVVADSFGAPAPRGAYAEKSPRAAYVDRILSFVAADRLAPLRVLVNAGNGTAGPTFDAIAAALAARGVPIEFIRLHHDPDGAFPNGIPNPLLPENQPVTAEAVRAHNAQMGVAWDGDFDRCFLFDETGAFIDGEYVVGLLAAAVLEHNPGARIVHDPRIVRNTRAIIARGGGEAVVSPTGHALIKQVMRDVDAVYGGEMSAHHYFRNFMYCDSGMIPWLMVAEHMSRTGKPLSALVADMRASHPSSGEINFRLADPDAAIAAVETRYLDAASGIDRLDGLSVDYDGWRFNLRKSNTEPVLRLNVETNGDRAALDRHVADLERLIRGAGGGG